MTSHGTEPVLIGIDVGTSSVKAVMAAPGGRRIDAFSGTHPTQRATPGMAEQAPADWMGHVEAALARFAAHPRAADVVAVGVTSQVNTHVFCDAGHAPLRPAITWQDTRPAAEAARLGRPVGPGRKARSPWRAHPHRRQPRAVAHGLGRGAGARSAGRARHM